MNMNNTIGRVLFDFRMQNETFARSLYAGWDSFFISSFEKVADELLKRYDTASEVIEIDCLDLDMGTLTEENFYEMFPVKLREAMEDNLRKSLSSSGEEKPEHHPARRISVEKSAFELLCYFLLHGSLPWNVSTEHIDITRLFLQVIENSPAELKRFLQLYGHYTTLQQRLVYQLNDPELEEGVRLMRSTESTFICSYIRYLREKYNSLERPEITATNYRHAVWIVVYAWMLTDRSSSFDRKSFLQQTLSGLSAHLNISYLTLLWQLTKDIESVTSKQSQLPELLHLLLALRDDSAEQLRKEKLPDIPVLFDHLSTALQKEITERLDDPAFTPEVLSEWLINILSHADTCRHFLSRLKEEEIIRLLPIIIPRESEFVIGYARSLDEQKQTGSLQGKAGSEFTRLKWMVIFPVLFENRSAGFNRKYFVRKVLKSVAAHYNLTVADLLQYFMQQEVIRKLDKTLSVIFESLYTEVKDIRALELSKQDETAVLLNKLTTRKELTEKEYGHLITTLAPTEEKFILQYATALDHHQQQGLFEGKAGGEFRHIKWYFIVHVLTEKTGVSINRRHFVASVLRHLSAHYNLAYFDLLQYFYTGNRIGQLPPALSTILRDLYQEEKRQLITRILSVSQEAERYRLLETLYPAEAAFIRSFLQLMETIPLRQEAHIRNSYSRFIWEKIFMVLIEYANRPFVKQLYIYRLLHLFATHYKIKTETLYKQLSNSVRQKTTTSPDIKQIIMDQSNHWNDLDFIQPNNNANAHGEPDVYYVPNAGVVLIFPFLTRLFSILKLVENGKFVSEEAKIRAIFILQYVVYGDTYSRKEFPEYELTLNKILVGYNSESPLPKSLELTENEKKTTDDMLKGVLSHWEKLSRTSIAALRQAFLERSGALKVEDERYFLTVEEKAYDILIDSMPWSYKLIRYPWMEKRIEVKWR